MEAVLVSRQIPVWQDRRAIALLMAASLTTMANATIAPALPGWSGSSPAIPTPRC